MHNDEDEVFLTSQSCLYHVLMQLNGRYYIYYIIYIYIYSTKAQNHLGQNIIAN